MARTPRFQCGNWGSIPRGGTSLIFRDPEVVSKLKFGQLRDNVAIEIRFLSGLPKKQFSTIKNDGHWQKMIGVI